MSSGWDEWESTDAAAPGQSPSTAPQSRRQRRKAAKLAKRETRRGEREERTRSAQRTALSRLGSVSGLWPAVAAIALVIAIALNVEDDQGLAAEEQQTAADPGTTSSAAVSAAVPIELDPHATVEVLPPAQLPPAPDQNPSPGQSGEAAALAFAEQACATEAQESPLEYTERLRGVATSEVASTWSRGTAAVVRCLQVTASTDEKSGQAYLSGVQVYRESAGGPLRAFRWTAEVTVAKQDTGTTWWVTA